MQMVYRVSYYAGVQTLRLLHRLGRFLTLLFLPIRLLVRRLCEVLRRHRGRTLRAKLVTFRGYCTGAGRRVREAWCKTPLLGILQVFLLPIEAMRRYRHVVKGAVTVVAIVLTALLLQATLRYWNSITFALALTDSEGDTIGYVSDELELQAGIAMAQERLETTDILLEAAIKPDVSLHMIPQASVLERAEICDYLLFRTDAVLLYASGVYIDGIFCGAVEDRDALEQLLEEILEDNCDGKEGVTASFFETVELLDGQYPQPRILSPEEMKKFLMSDSRLQVLVSGTIQYEVEVPYSVQRVADASSYEGSERVRTNGEKGLNRVTATVTYLNGEQLSSVITSSTVIKEPVTQVVAYGTKAIDKNYQGGANATGRFVWPTPDTRYVSQYFHARHGGLDIWSRDMTGEDIVAADGGTVIVAVDPKGTTYWSYGKYIIIDHGGGYQTLYAHCDELFVKTGDKVIQGQRIAAVGNTGRSTSPHLHFEVRVNGRAVNPMKFF